MKFASTLIMGCLALASSILVSNCSSSADTATNLTISGSLSSSVAIRAAGRTVDFTLYKMRCMTLGDTLSVGNGDIGADGTFSIELENGLNEPVGCFVLLKSDSSVVASLTITTTDDSFSGSGDASVTTFEPTGDVTLTLTFDPEAGTLTGNASEISGASTAGTGDSSSWIDVDGEWNLECVTDTAAGFTCETGPSRQGFRDGGPGSVYLHQISGTMSGNTVNGLAIWASESAYTGCGGVEGDSDEMPSGLTISSGDASAFTSSGFTFEAPNPANTTVEYGIFNDGGTDKIACGVTYTDGMNCNSVTNVGMWGNGTATFSDNDCKAICLANNINKENPTTTTCDQRYNVDYSKTNDVTAGGQLACSGMSCGNGAGAGFVSGSGKPRNRYMFDRFYINGDTGTMSSTETNTEHICVGTTGGACTEHNCPMVEQVNFVMKQSSATAGVVTVEFKKSLASGAPSACSQDLPGNHVYNRLGTQRQRFNVTKSSR